MSDLNKKIFRVVSSLKKERVVQFAMHANSLGSNDLILIEPDELLALLWAWSDNEGIALDYLCELAELEKRELKKPLHQTIHEACKKLGM